MRGHEARNAGIVRSFAVLLLLSATGCILDRTGHSASEAYQRELALQATRTEALNQAYKETTRRIEQMEEVTRASGQEEIYRMETVDQLRNEVANLRGDVETIQHSIGLDSEFSTKFQEDAEYRLSWLEQRATAIEKSLALPTPPPPTRTGETTEVAEGSTSSTTTTVATVDPTTEAVTPDDQLALARKHIDENHGAAARAVLERFVKENGTHAKADEARYLLGQAWYNDSEYQRAILAYQDVLDKTPTSQWASWSMLRQGQCFSALGQKDNASLFYDDVMRLYPKSKAAKEAKTLKAR